MRAFIILLLLILTSVTYSVGQTIDTTWTLSRMIEHAIGNNITVKQTVLGEQSAAVNLTQSKAATFPSLSASASQSVNRGTSADPITYDYVSSTIHSTSVGINAQATIYAGNKIQNAIHQHKVLVEQNQLRTNEAKNNIMLSITEAYLRTLYFHEGISIAQNDVNSSTQQLKRTEALYNAGSVSAKEYADMKAQNATAHYSLVTAQISFDKEKLALKQLLELDPSQEFDLEIIEIDNELPIAVPNKVEIYESALKTMPEIKAQQLQRDVEVLDVKIAKAAYQPTLSLNAGLASGYTTTQEFAFEQQLQNNFYQRLGLSLTIPIFSNFKTKSSVQLAQINMRSAELDLLAERKELYQKIETAHQQLTSAMAELGAIKAQMEASEASYALAIQQHELGLLSTVDMVVSQNDFRAAQQKFIQTKYTAVLYAELLEFYQGHDINI